KGSARVCGARVVPCDRPDGKRAGSDGRRGRTRPRQSDAGPQRVRLHRVAVNASARLIVPAVRWHDDRGFDGEQSAIDAALELGVGGFCLFGGTAAAVRELTTELRARSAVPLLIASD